MIGVVIEVPPCRRHGGSSECRQAWPLVAAASRSTRSARSAKAVRNAAGVPARTGSGTDQWRDRRRERRRRLVGPVADGDDEVRLPGNAVVAFRRRGREVEAELRGGPDRVGMDPFGGLRAGAVGGSAGPVAPEGGGELRAGRVVGAHEEHALRRRSPVRRRCPSSRSRRSVDVAAAMVTLRHSPLDQACRLEHVQVMGRGVAWAAQRHRPARERSGRRAAARRRLGADDGLRVRRGCGRVRRGASVTGY